MFQFREFPFSIPAAARTHKTAHVVNRALAVHALLAAGRAPKEVERRLGKSKGYVGVLGYLGAALTRLEAEDLARLRAPALTPRVVWPLVTRARTDERVAVREALSAVTTDAAHNEVRRRSRDRATVQLRAALRAHVQATASGLAAPPRTRGDRRPRSVMPNALSTLAWAPAAWAADPVAYACAHLTRLAAAREAVVRAAVHAADTALTERAIAGEFGSSADGSLRILGRITPARWRALADAARTGRSPDEVRGLAMLTRVAAGLRLHEPGATAAGHSAVRLDGVDVAVAVDADAVD